MIWESKKIEREMMEESRKWREEEATKRKAAAEQKEAEEQRIEHVETYYGFEARRLVINRKTPGQANGNPGEST